MKKETVQKQKGAALSAPQQPPVHAVEVEYPGEVLLGYVEKIPSFIAKVNELTGETGVHEVKDQMTVRILRDTKPPESIDYAAGVIPARWIEETGPNALTGEEGRPDHLVLPKIQWWDVARGVRVKIHNAGDKNLKQIEALRKFWALIPQETR